MKLKVVEINQPNEQKKKEIIKKIKELIEKGE